MRVMPSRNADGPLCRLQLLPVPGLAAMIIPSIADQIHRLADYIAGQIHRLADCQEYKPPLALTSPLLPSSPSLPFFIARTPEGLSPLINRSLLILITARG